MPPPPAIDPAAISSLRELGGEDEDFLGEIIGIFLSDMPLRITELEQGLAAGDKDKYLRAAHSIKGSAANLGAMRLQESAERLETQARLSGAAGLAPRVAEVKGEYNQARLELELLRRKP